MNRLISPGPSPPSGPLVSVIVLNYNGAFWLKRCLESLREQTLFDRMELIVADNASPDHSEHMARELLEGWTNARVVQNGGNFGYSEGNNLAAQSGRGKYLFFLNNDTWLEKDCLERLVAEVEAAGAVAGTPLVLDYLDDVMQSAGECGFDAFGLVCGSAAASRHKEVFVAVGCSLLIEAGLFRSLGGFDSKFFMYADEYDLCWRVWLSGGCVILAHSARLHHRGAASVNPNGHEKVVESRTSDSKRFYANRNNLLVLLKNSQHVLLGFVPLQIGLLAIEGAFMGCLTRRWSHVRRAYLEAVGDCWRLRGHVLAERRRLRRIRRRSDFWMLRFFRLRFNRWLELKRWRKLGAPRVDAN